MSIRYEVSGTLFHKMNGIMRYKKIAAYRRPDGTDIRSIRPKLLLRFYKTVY